MANIGTRIRAHRTKRGWSLRELSRRSGVSNPFLCQVENGRNLGVEALVAIAKALKVKASELLGER